MNLLKSLIDKCQNPSSIIFHDMHELNNVQSLNLLRPAWIISLVQIHFNPHSCDYQFMHYKKWRPHKSCEVWIVGIWEISAFIHLRCISTFTMKAFLEIYTAVVWFSLCVITHSGRYKIRLKYWNLDIFIILKYWNISWYFSLKYWKVQMNIWDVIIHFFRNSVQFFKRIKTSS